MKQLTKKIVLPRRGGKIREASKGKEIIDVIIKRKN